MFLKFYLWGYINKENFYFVGNGYFKFIKDGY